MRVGGLAVENGLPAGQDDGAGPDVVVGGARADGEARPVGEGERPVDGIGLVVEIEDRA